MSAPARDAFAAEAEDPYALAPADGAKLLAGAPWRRLAILGDSLAEGLGDPSPGYRPLSRDERLHEALSLATGGTEVLNLGRRDLVAREVREQQLDRALAWRPDLAVLTAGGNDALGQAWDPDAVEEELATMVAALRGAGADVVTFRLMDLGAAFPAFRGTWLQARLDELDARTAAVTARHGGWTVDVHASPACAQPWRMSADLKHASHAGQALIAAEVVRRLAREVA